MAYIIFFGILFGIILPIVLINDNKRAKELKAQRIARNEVEKEELANRKKIFDEWLNEQVSKFGELTKNISYYVGDDFYLITKRVQLIDKSILIFESSETIVIEKNPYKFKDIVSFEVFDNSKTIYSGSTATTKTNTGSMIGRAVVGGVLLGGVGAAIGGATAKKETEISGQTSRTTHDYDIIVTVNSIASPIIKISLGKNQETMQEIASIFSIILERNKQN